MKYKTFKDILSSKGGFLEPKISKFVKKRQDIIDKLFFEVAHIRIISEEYDSICGDFEDRGFIFKTMSDGGRRDCYMARKIHKKMLELGIKSNLPRGERCNYMTYKDLYKFLNGKTMCEKCGNRIKKTYGGIYCSDYCHTWAQNGIEPYTPSGVQ